MIGVDTNVLVRYLVRDDAAQTQRATRLLEQHLTRENPGYLSMVVLVELAWVLRRRYRVSAAELGAILERLLSTPVFVIENDVAVSEAAVAVRRGRCDFADALIGASARRAGCSHTVTFDKGALRLPGFAPL